MKLSIVKFVTKLSIFLFIPLLFVSNSYASNCNDQEGSFNCVDYIRSYDGDTIFVNLQGVHSFFGSEISVRVRGIDTGEVKNHEGRTQCELEMAFLAKDEVERVFNKSNEIELRDTQRGKYFRVLADIYVNGRSLAKHLIKKGLAVPYEGGDRSNTDWCKLQKRFDKILAQEKALVAK